MGKKSKAKGNKNNQQAAKVTSAPQEPSATSNKDISEPVADAPVVIAPKVEEPKAQEAPVVPVEEKDTKKEQQEPEGDDAPTEGGQSGKKKRNRNRNKKKNQQNAQEECVVENVVEVSNNVQNKEETAEKTLNASSKRSQRNKKKNAEKANQVASADENRTGDEAIEKANESGDTVVANDAACTKVPTENLSKLSKDLPDKSQSPAEKNDGTTKESVIKPDVTSTESKSEEKPVDKPQQQPQLQPQKSTKQDASSDVKGKGKGKAQNKSSAKEDDTKPKSKADVKTECESVTQIDKPIDCKEKPEQVATKKVESKNKVEAKPKEIETKPKDSSPKEGKQDMEVIDAKTIDNKESHEAVKLEASIEVKAETKSDVKSEVSEVLTLENKEDIKANVKLHVKADAKQSAKPDVKAGTKPDVKAGSKPNVKSNVKSDTKPEIKPEIKDIKPDIKPEIKPDVKEEVKSQVKPDNKPDANIVVRPEEQIEQQPSVTPKKVQQTVPEKKQDDKTKGDKSPKKPQKPQKTDQKANEKKTKPEYASESEGKQSQGKTESTDKSSDNQVKANETKELAKLIDASSKVEVPLVDPITIQISQPLVITAEVCKDKPQEPSTEATLAQLIELVSNTDIPLHDICPTGVKEKMAEFQKPIAETGAALAELVNVVAGVEVPLTDVDLPVIEDKNDKEAKGKKGKQQKINETKTPVLQKVQESKKPDPKKQEAKQSECKKDNKTKEATGDTKKDSPAKDKKEVDEPKVDSQQHPKPTLIAEVENKKESPTSENKITETIKETIKTEDVEVTLKSEPKTEIPKPSEIPDLNLVESVIISAEKSAPKPVLAQTPKKEEGKPGEPMPISLQQSAQNKVDQAASEQQNKNQGPPISKKNKDDANIKAAKEKSEAKAKEVPEKNPQEKMDAISFVPDKLLDILDTKMQTPPANTGAIKKIPKQKAEQATTEMAAQTQISVLPTFHDKPSEKEQQKQDKSGKVSPQKSPSKSPAPKKPQVPPKPEHLLKKAAQKGPAQQPEQQTPKKPPILSDDEEEFIEYKFTPRQVFLATICHVCKLGLQNPTPCSNCLMVSYCSEAHAKDDVVAHQPLCRALQEIARKRGGHVYNNAKILSNDDFRNLRVHTLNLCESLTQRPLQPFEKEILIFPRICCTATCREWRPQLLVECSKCGQVSYCREQPNHLPEDHQRWCPFFLLYQKLIIRQKTIGRIEPTLPSRIFLQRYELPATIDDVFKELYKNSPTDDCSYATLTQLATAPLTAFSALHKTQLSISETLTIHLVGAELQFEGDTLDKWEAFFLHLIPQVMELRVVFIGPELNAENLPLDILSRIRMCRTCRQSCRGVKFDFQCGKLYHDYAKQSAFTKPDLICFFNPGLYRATGFSGLDTWPETIKATTSLNCPITVTSYTEVEAPQDLAQLHRFSTRPLNLIHPPTVNPFSSQRPERNFISDETSPMIFKNYFVFIVS